ncbi:PglL family O-oligosaccharyltransferase [Vibrio mimicus]|uniref:PglL family O-oligosaccharyltransferase n=1 Tax=Vibrio mimicus TaxID=674 RepID=UPI00165273A6|nr:PglL family O-oligosaccharyltransferase [Vibrio mimicus]
MATLLLSGTRLEPHTPSLPLNKPFLFSLAVLYLLAMHFFMPNPGGAGLALSFNNTTWIALSITLAIGLYQLANNQVLRYSKLTIGLWISCVLLTLPITYSNADWPNALSRLVGLWAGFTLFVVLQQFRFSNKHKQRLLWFILLATVIEAIIGLIQYFWLDPGNPFGYDTKTNRPYGIFQQPNVMASFLATGLVISGYLLARQPEKYDSPLSKIGVLYLTPLLTAPLLVVLASRTGWIASVLSIALVSPYLYRFASRQRFTLWLLAIVLGISAGFAAMYSLGTSGFVENKTDLESPRRFTFPQTIDMVIEKPFTGYGYGQFEAQYLLYTARQHQLNSSYPPGLASMDHPHNELLYWGVEGGLLPVLGILLAACFCALRIYGAKRGTRLAMLALFVPIALHAQLEYPFYHSAIHWITFIILIYWVDQRVARYRIAHFSALSKSLLRITSLVLPIMTSLYMITALHTNYVLTQFEKSQPRDPELLKQVTNPLVWQDRFDWDIYSTYLQVGLYEQKAELIQPYVDWSLQVIQHKPRPAFYTNLILAYQGLGDASRAQQIRSEAEFLFPNQDFSTVQYQPPSTATSTASGSAAQSEAAP